MSLKFLFKKGFHPARLDIQEKIWKAEQAKDAEEKRIAELRQKIEEEKNLDELRKLQEIAGGRGQSGSGLDWMYSGPQAQKQEQTEEDNEAYLTGKKAIGSSATGKAAAPGDFDVMASSSRLNAITDGRAAVSTAAASRGPAIAAAAPLSRNEEFRVRNEDPLLDIQAREAAAQARAAARDALLNDPAIRARLKGKLQSQLGEGIGQGVGAGAGARANDGAAAIDSRGSRPNGHIQGGPGGAGPTRGQMPVPAWKVQEEAREAERQAEESRKRGERGSGGGGRDATEKRGDRDRSRSRSRDRHHRHKHRHRHRDRSRSRSASPEAKRSHRDDRDDHKHRRSRRSKSRSRSRSRDRRPHDRDQDEDRARDRSRDDVRDRDRDWERRRSRSRDRDHGRDRDRRRSDQRDERRSRSRSGHREEGRRHSDHRDERYSDREAGRRDRDERDVHHRDSNRRDEEQPPRHVQASGQPDQRANGHDGRAAAAASHDDDGGLSDEEHGRVRPAQQAQLQYGLTRRGETAQDGGPAQARPRTELGPSRELIEARSKALAAVGKLPGQGRTGLTTSGAPAASGPAPVDREASLASMKEAAKARVVEMQSRLAQHREEGASAADVPSGRAGDALRGDGPSFLSSTATAAMNRVVEARRDGR